MKPRPSLAFLALIACLGLRLPAEPPQLDPSSNPRFTQTRTRIDSLFQYRNTALPPPDPRTNPFRTAAEIAIAGSSIVPGVPVLAPDSDDALLQAAAATLKITGMVVKDGRAKLIINGGAYEEGGVISVRVRGKPAYVKIRHITLSNVTLTLNDAELTISY